MKENQKKQSGRSMLEMLGVLAIIGVLSIGGILGFRMAMNKVRANRIAHDASLAYTTVTTSNGGYTAWAAVPLNTESGLVFSAVRQADVNGVLTTYVRSEEIPPAVCEQLLKMKSDVFNLYETDMQTEIENCANPVNANGLKTMVFALSSAAAGNQPDPGPGPGPDPEPEVCNLTCQNGGSPNTDCDACNCINGYSGPTCTIDLNV